MHHSRILTTLFCLSLGLFLTCTTQAAPQHITTVVLPFDTTATGDKDLGDQISQLVGAYLSQLDSITLVDRQSMSKILEEHEINLSGMVDDAHTIKLGKLVGARLMITGKAFQLGKSINITAKLVGTETSLVRTVLVSGTADSDLGELVLKLAEKITATYQSKAQSLVAQDATETTLADWQKKLKDKKLPAVVVYVPEQHVASRPPAKADPAVETQIKHQLLACGVTIYDVDGNKLAQSLKTKNKQWPTDTAKADWIIFGEAFSEFGARIGNLNSCQARVEINIIDKKTGKLIAADKEMARAVDLGENLAGRKALQLAATRLTWRILEKLAAQ